MKSFENFIKLIEDDDEQWITTRGGHHVLIDPDSGEIKSGKLKGTNIEDFKKNAEQKLNKSKEKTSTNKVDKNSKKHLERVLTGGSDSVTPQERSLLRSAKNYASEVCADSKSFGKNGSATKEVEKAMEELSKVAGKNNKKFNKLKKDYQEAKRIMDNERIVKVMDVDVEKEIKNIELLKKEKNGKDDDLIDNIINSKREKLEDARIYRRSVEQYKKLYMSIITKYKFYKDLMDNDD